MNSFHWPSFLLGVVLLPTLVAVAGLLHGLWTRWLDRTGDSTLAADGAPLEFTPRLIGKLRRAPDTERPSDPTAKAS